MPYYVENSYPIFTDLDGAPLHNGYVFIGVENLDPISNPQDAFWDEDLTIPATNIRTLNGYLSYSGSPGRVFAQNKFSILVQNAEGETVYFNPKGYTVTVGLNTDDLSGLANGYLPVGSVLPNNGITFPGFLESGTTGHLNAYYPELAALSADLDFIVDNGDGTFDILPVGFDTGWVANSAWEGQIFTITHNIGKPLSELNVVVEVSELGNDVDSRRVLDINTNDATVGGATLYASSNDELKVYTGDDGIELVNTDGTALALTTQSWFYRVVISRRDLPYNAQIKAQVVQNGDALTTLFAETGWTELSDWIDATINFSHNLSTTDPFVQFWISTDGTSENAFLVGFSTDETNEKGVTLYIDDNQSVTAHTGTNGILITDIDGTPITIAAQTWYYNLRVYKPQLVTNSIEPSIGVLLSGNNTFTGENTFGANSLKLSATDWGSLFVKVLTKTRPAWEYTGFSTAPSFAVPSKNGLVVYSGGDDNTVKEINASDGTEGWTFSGHTNTVRNLVSSPDGTKLYTSSDDNTVKEINASDGTEGWTFSGHTFSAPFRMFALAISPDGSKLYSGASDDVVKEINASDGTEGWTYSGRSDEIRSLVVSPDGSKVYCGSRDDVVAEINASDGTEGWTFSGHTASVFALAISPDGSKLYSAGFDNTIREINTSDGSGGWTFTGHTGAINSLAISSDGTKLYSGASDSTVRKIDALSGVEEWSSTRHDFIYGVSINLFDSILYLSIRSGPALVEEISTFDGESTVSFPVLGLLP
jgi:WD40 repeat protein